MRSALRPVPAAVLGVTVLSILAGCSAAPSTPTPPATPAAETTTTSPGVDVAAGKALSRVNASETVELEYRDLSITVAYRRSNGTNTVTVTVGDRERTVRREVDADPATVSWTWDGFRYEVTPVTFDTRDGERVALLERTWNVTTVQVEVYPTSS